MDDKSLPENAKPFLRWAGGKRRLVPFLVKHIPPDFSNNNRYCEPFLGAGSLFFRLQPSQVTLSDNNKDLIDCYRAVQKRPDLVAKYLRQHLLNNCEDYYYKMRKRYNNSKLSIAKAALFIYLNRTCFNGIWRVNEGGEFNVPYGRIEIPPLPSKEDLLNLSQTLTKATIIHSDYKQVVKHVSEGDFIYFDPPYPPLNGTSFFTHYTKERFNKKDHAELASLVNMLNKKGCYIMVSNADTPYIRGLYGDTFNIYELEVVRWIRTDGKRYKVQEIVITNYEV